MPRWFSLLFVVLVTGLTFPTLLKAQSSDCGAPPRLYAGGQGYVLPSNVIRVRAQPNTSAEQRGELYGGTTFTVEDGYRCNGGYNWWQIRRGDLVGWAVEGDASNYFVEPAEPTINPPLFANSLTWSPDSRWLAVATNRGSWLFDTEQPESDFRRVGRPANDVAFRSETELVIATPLLADREYGFSFYETTSGRLLEQEITGWEGVVSPPPDPSYQSLDYAPDSTIYAYRQDRWIVVVDSPRELFLSQIADGSHTVELAFLPDASAALVLYMTDDGGRIGIHDLGRPTVGRELLTPLDLDLDATSIALNADGSRFAIGDADGKILLGVWSAPEDVRAVAAADDAIQSLTLSPDGATLVAAAGNLLMFIDTQSGEITSTLTTSLPINDLAYNPTGEQVAILTERSIQLIESISQESLLEFTFEP